ncbi:MAG: adenylate cyclase [Clostridiales bacterium]|nr:adenylate cyclase [Clostridiales bacterium]
MNTNIKNTNLRFNMDKEIQRRAWEYLQTMDKEIFKSYSHVIAVSVVDFFERYYRVQDDPYLETREREERFVAQIVDAVKAVLEKDLPVFLAGCLSGLSQRMAWDSAPAFVSAQAELSGAAGETEEAEPEIDWEFLGG